MSWEKVKLRDVLTHRKGSISISDSDSYKLCRVRLHRKGVLLREVKTGSTIKTKKQQLCKANDFIVAEMDAKVGGYGFIPADLDGAIVSSHYYLFEVNENLLKRDFLAVLNKTQTLQNQIRAVGSTNYARVSPSDVLAWEIPLPSIEDQERIAETIKIFEANNDQLLTELDHQLALVKGLRQAYLREAMQGKLVPQDPTDEPAESLLEKIKAEKERLVAEKRIKRDKPVPPINPEELPFEIPSNWTWSRLGEISNLRRGKSKHRPRNDSRLFEDGRFPFIQTGDVSKAKFNNDLVTTINGYYNDFGLGQSEMQKEGTLCITIAANIAECGFLGFDACVPDSIVCLSAKTKATEKYAYYYLKIAKEELERFAPATAQKNINLGILNQLSIPLPPLAEQERIVAKLEKLMKFCDELEANIKQGIANADRLLQTALKEALEPRDHSLNGKNCNA